MKKIWTYNVDKYDDGTVESVLVHDHDGKWVACLPGPGMAGDDVGNTNELAVQRARTFIKMCGAEAKEAK